VSWKESLSEVIARQFDLQAAAGLSESALEDLLTRRIEELIASRPEYFFHLMYRIDLDESQLHQALTTATEPARRVAQMVIRRQKEKWAARRKKR